MTFKYEIDIFYYQKNDSYNYSVAALGSGRYREVWDAGIGLSENQLIEKMQEYRGKDVSIKIHSVVRLNIERKIGRDI